MNAPTYRLENPDGYLFYRRQSPRTASLKIVYKKIGELYRAVHGNVRQILREMQDDEQGELDNHIDNFFIEILDQVQAPDALEWEVDLPGDFDALQMRFQMTDDGSVIRVPLTTINNTHQLHVSPNMRDGDILAAQQAAYQQWIQEQMQRKYRTIFRSYNSFMKKRR